MTSHAQWDSSPAKAGSWRSHPFPEGTTSWRENDEPHGEPCGLATSNQSQLRVQSLRVKELQRYLTFNKLFIIHCSLSAFLLTLNPYTLNSSYSLFILHCSLFTVRCPLFLLTLNPYTVNLYPLLFSAQICAKCTMVSTAFSMSWMQIHSFLLWKLWPPVKTLGVNNPM